MIGQTLSHYAILAKIGSGGMGDVYLAEDRTLGRRVALKTLPPDVASPDRRARFAREAKTLAALNHPNIVTVHSVEEAGGVSFITMELVDGKTLAELLPRDGFPLDRFFDLAIPLADAVAAAHQQGVVHRDLKPGNVMVTHDERLKVLDFGLAKPVEGPGADAVTAATSGAGLIVGTCGYMSPEQARGQPVDARSDVFALGVVFYEMLTGRRPFTGDTSTEILSSIIKDEPAALSSLRSGIPRELSRIIRHCLAKDPARRKQSALDVRNELEDLKREIDSGELAAVAHPAHTRASGARKAWWASAAVIAVLALAGFAGWRWLEGREARTIRLTNPRQVTFTSAVETSPTWSPDGGRIAYVSDQNGNEDIWVTPATGGAAVPLTADHSGRDVHPAWSPDGNQIAFVSQRDGGGIYVMPAIGGRPDPVSPQGIAEAQQGVAWSADGTALAHMRREPDANFIEIMTLETREVRRLRVPGEQGNRLDLSWSPNGRFFAYVRAANREQEFTRLWALRIADGEALAVTDGTSGDWSPMWSADARTLYFISNRGGSQDLWQQRLTSEGEREGEPVPLTVGVGMQWAALSPDGRKLAYSRGRPVANVFRVPILTDGEAGWEHADQLTSDEALVQSLDLVPGSEQLVISSDCGGSRDLWLTTPNGRDMRPLTTDRHADNAPRVSPKGRHIAYYSNREGNLDIWVLPLDGGPAVQLTRDPLSDMFPAWSHDGAAIVYYGGRDDGVQLFVIPVKGGEARPMTTGAGSRYFPQWSPDGHWLYHVSGEGPGRFQIFRMPAGGGDPEQVTTSSAYYYRWSHDGTRMYFTGTSRGSNDLWERTLADGRERQLTRFIGKPGSLGGESLAASKTHLYFTWRHDLGDIWVMDVAESR